MTLTFARGATRTARYTPTEARFECEAVARDSKGSEPCTRVHLVRFADDNVLLRNPRERLPIERDCGADFHTDERTVRRTPSDDRSFRLARRPVAACASKP